MELKESTYTQLPLFCAKCGSVTREVETIVYNKNDVPVLVKKIIVCDNPDCRGTRVQLQ